MMQEPVYNLIKNRSGTGSGDAGTGTVVKNQIIKARIEARRIIEEAEDYAHDLHRQSLAEADERLREAFERGTETALLEYQQILLEIREIREKILRETEKDILRLSVRLAEKIVGREIDEDKTAIRDIVANALQNARQKERVTIRVNPADLPNVRKHSEQFKSNAQTKYLDFIADPRVEAGGCLIESEVGTVDARLETQFRVLERALLAQADGEFVIDAE
jgi:type III secretion protein L